MNAFSRQGKALPTEVRNQIIEKWLSDEGTANISRQSNLPYKTVSNIGDLAHICMVGLIVAIYLLYPRYLTISQLFDF